MPIFAKDLEDIIRESFPDAQIEVSGDDGVHMSALIVDESFRRQKPRPATAHGLCGAKGQNGRA